MHRKQDCLKGRDGTGREEEGMEVGKEGVIRLVEQMGMEKCRGTEAIKGRKRDVCVE